MVRNLDNRYWVRYDATGSVSALYRLSFPGAFFELWVKGVWVDATDRYERITQDADCDEIGAEHAHEILHKFAEW